MSKVVENVAKSEEDVKKLEYIKNHPELIKKFTKVYNELCIWCKKDTKAKIVKGQSVNPNDWCPYCKEKASKIMGVKL